jgi:glutamyl-tRNA reductase
VLTVEMLRQVQRARRGRPLFLLDIAVPRDVEPEAGSLDGVYLADIDDLQKVAAEHRDERKSEADGAEAIVAQELDRFLKAWRGRQLGPTVTALRAHVLGVAQAEAARVLAANPGLGERERKLLSDMAESLAKKLLHAPQMALRNDDADGVPLVVAVQRLFALEVAAPAPLEGDGDEGAAPAPGDAPAGQMKDKKAAGR